MLKKKDGSEYKLLSPNPLMNTQILWLDEFKTHNMRWETEKDAIKKADKNVSSPVEVKETFLSALDKTQIEEMLEEDFKKEVIHEDLQRKEEIIEENQIKKIFIHCLPAKIRIKKDDLYSESYKTVQYENPISFEGVLLQEADLAIEIWTDTNDISVSSIIYPKLGSKRWWKIQEKTQKMGGWVLTGVPSSYQPSFD